MSLRPVYAFACFALVACGENKAILSLAELCPELASDICEVRDGCCNQPDIAGCIEAEQPSCEARLGGYTMEQNLDYDSEYAAHQRSAARASLDRCQAPPVLARFFKGGLPLGTPCERDAQCAGGRCSGEPLACVDAAPEPLCAAP